MKSSTSATRDRIYKSNKDENAHRFALSAIRWEILERERKRERERERERERKERERIRESNK